jgi:hypothetical protein
MTPSPTPLVSQTYVIVLFCGGVTKQPEYNERENKEQRWSWFPLQFNDPVATGTDTVLITIIIIVVVVVVFVVIWWQPVPFFLSS